MSTENQLVALDDISIDKAPAIYGHNKLNAYVALAREQAANEVPDLTTKKGRDRIASLAAQVSRSKTAVEKPGREYLKRIKEMPKAIEAELREFVNSMDALRDEVRAPLNEWEQAEADRVAGHERRIEELRTIDTEDRTAAEIASAISLIEEAEIGADWEEFEAEAHRVKAATLTTLQLALTKRQAYEAEQTELERLRAEAAQREQAEREARIAREAAEQAQREAEQRAQAERDAAAKREADAKAAAEQRELQLKLEAEQSARRELEAQQRAEQAERKAIDDALLAVAEERRRLKEENERIEAEAKAREADKAHKAAINRAALEAFIAGGMPEACAKQAVTLIAKRQIPNIQITY
ncbi:MAG TPA: hypothetical protein DCR78_08945 [Pseudomonas sp.]|nr:hypothetical protein [Pseudomonas sp.]